MDKNNIINEPYIPEKYRGLPFKEVFIINGSGGVGKDSFVKMVGSVLSIICEHFDKERASHYSDIWYEEYPCVDNYGLVGNYSSVDEIKYIAKLGRWDGGKTEKDRKFLSDLKLLFTAYNDLPFQKMSEAYENFLKNRNTMFLFLHIREPEEIEKAAKAFHAKTVLVKRPEIEQIKSNMADANVENYNYDYVVWNNGTPSGLFEEAQDFLLWVKSYWTKRSEEAVQLARKEMNESEQFHKFMRVNENRI